MKTFNLAPSFTSLLLLSFLLKEASTGLFTEPVTPHHRSLDELSKQEIAREEAFHGVISEMARQMRAFKEDIESQRAKMMNGLDENIAKVSSLSTRPNYTRVNKILPR